MIEGRTVRLAWEPSKQQARNIVACLLISLCDSSQAKSGTLGQHCMLSTLPGMLSQLSCMHSSPGLSVQHTAVLAAPCTQRVQPVCHHVDNAPLNTQVLQPACLPVRNSLMSSFMRTTSGATKYILTSSYMDSR